MEFASKSDPQLNWCDLYPTGRLHRHSLKLLQSHAKLRLSGRSSVNRLFGLILFIDVFFWHFSYSKIWLLGYSISFANIIATGRKYEKCMWRLFPPTLVTVHFIRAKINRHVYRYELFILCLFFFSPILTLRSHRIVLLVTFAYGWL